MEDVTRASAHRSEQTAASVHHYESKGGVVLQQLLKGFRVELVVAQVQRGVDGTEGLEGVRHLLLLALLVQTRSTIQDQTIGRHTGEPTLTPWRHTYSFNFCWVDVMAPNTDRRFTRDLMLEAVPYSPVSILLAFEIYRVRQLREHLTWSPGRMIREIMEVPFLEDETSSCSSYPRAFSRVLISFLILHISMFFSSGLILLKSYNSHRIYVAFLRAF